MSTRQPLPGDSHSSISSSRLLAALAGDALTERSTEPMVRRELEATERQDSLTPRRATSDASSSTDEEPPIRAEFAGVYSCGDAMPTRKDVAAQCSLASPSRGEQETLDATRQCTSDRNPIAPSAPDDDAPIPPRWFWIAANLFPCVAPIAWIVAALRRGEPRLLLQAAAILVSLPTALAASNLFAWLFIIDGNEWTSTDWDSSDWTKGDPPTSLVLHGWLILFALAASYGASIRAAAWQWRTWWYEAAGGEVPFRRSADWFERIEGLPRASDATPRLFERTKKSYAMCVALWLVGGWCGLHRFYTGRPISGLLFALTGGFAGVGWASDLVLLDGLCRRAIRPLQRDEQPAAWADDGRRLGVIDFVGRLLFFVAAPAVFTLACMMYGHFELLAVLGLVVIPCGLLGNAGRSLARLEAASSLPILGTALGFVRQLYEFYRDHAPRGFLFYLLYPLTCPIMAIYSRPVRREFRLYSKFIGALVAVVTVKYIVEYPSTFPPFLGVADAFGLVFMHALLAILGTFVILMPITATAFTYHFTGRRGRLRTLAALTVLIAVPVGGMTYWLNNASGGASAPSQVLLEFRLEKPEFRAELQAATEMFLRHHIDAANGQSLAESTDGLGQVATGDDAVLTGRDVTSGVVWQAPAPAEITTASSESESAPAWIDGEQTELTEQYRRLVSGLTTRGEAAAFRVFAIDASNGADPPATSDSRAIWLGIHVSVSPPFVAALIRPDGKLADDAVCTHWDELPEEIRRRFLLDPSASPNGIEVQRIATQQLIGDWK